MSSYTQEERLIAISVNGLADNTLLLQSLTGTESASHLYSFDLELLSESYSLDFTTIIGQKAVIRILTPDVDNPRYINGYVSRFAQSGADDRFYHYHMEVVPWLWFLTRHADCRIFHNATIPEIIKKVFEGFTAKTKGPIQYNLQLGNYTKLEYCVQYRETSLNFVSRLMEHAGIYYYFQHTEDDHTLVLVDNSASASPCPIQPSASHAVKNPGEDNIAAIYARREFKTGQYTSTDYNFETPAANLVASENTVISVGGNDPLETFDYPGIHGTADEGRKISKIRMEEHEASHHLISGSGRVRSFLPGYTFTLKDHYRPDLNGSYLLTEVRHGATVGGSYVHGDSGSGEHYSNHFTCIPAAVPFRPVRQTPKPFVQGPQTAVVIGKADYTDTSGDDGGGDGEEIWVDSFGRVVVRFPWDRAGKCSCRVRVSQAWAGQGWGGMTIPRVGQEVIVSFLEGDPDRPIITGRVYNASQTVPYALPDYQTRSTLMTRSSKGGGADNYNELRFEDKKGGEQVFIRGEKDQDTHIKNDVREWVGNNRSLIVTKDHMEKISGDHHAEVVGNQNQKIGQTLSLQVGQNLYEKSGMNYAHQAGEMIHLKAGMTVVIEAGTQLTLKVGGNFVDISPAGVTIVGTLVMINSGGAAGAGCGSSPTAPTAPDQADDGSKGTKM